ncbi:unnamed protein product [Prunus armeniaca]|uniref:Uncharacterized protein n=1 Tax=Prunus armeniaca TaxID=36596 RepID=A0A6J5UFV7_PRUAR|nr:unnamed protein product [Prunus armeniaca]CAB4303719.1 unnamed protein product [Prunus armeniaca]
MQLWPMKTNPCLWTLPKENWVGERSRSSGSKTQQTVKSPSAKGAMGCSRRPMNSLYSVMQRLPS